MLDPAVSLAASLVAIDSRSSVSNVSLADRIARELRGFDVEQLDYNDAAGVAKRVLVAHKGPMGGGLAFSGCPHRRIPISDSDPFRSLIPEHSDQPFRRIAIARSDAFRSACA